VETPVESDPQWSSLNRLPALEATQDRGDSILNHRPRRLLQRLRRHVVFAHGHSGHGAHPREEFLEGGSPRQDGLRDDAVVPRPHGPPDAFKGSDPVAYRVSRPAGESDEQHDPYLPQFLWVDGGVETRENPKVSEGGDPRADRRHAHAQASRDLPERKAGIRLESLKNPDIGPV